MKVNPNVGKQEPVNITLWAFEVAVIVPLGAPQFGELSGILTVNCL
jgi:hypothetical protein